MKIEKRPLSKLMKLKTPFDFSYGPVPRILYESIKKIGVTHPPCVQESSNPTDEILISGKRRLQVLFELDQNPLLVVHVFSSEELSKLEAFHINLFENLAARSLNTIEKSNVLILLTQDFHVSTENLLKNYLPHLNLPVKEETIHEYLKLQEVDERMKNLVALGHLQVDSAIQLLKFGKTDRSLLLDFIQNLHLGVNPQKTLIKLAWEVFKKTNASFNELMKQEIFKKILSEENWSPSQKWARIEEELKKLRYPILSQLESQFKNLKKALKLPPTLTLQNPPYFETSDYLLQFRFRNLKEFHNHLKTLNDAGASEALKQLFKLTDQDGPDLPT